MNSTIILSHSGKQHAYHVAKALNDLDSLEKFYTSAYVTSKRMQDWLINRGDTFWTRRFLMGLHGDKVESNWRFEVKEIFLSKLFGQNQRTLNAVYARDEQFDLFMARRMKKLKGDIFWGFQGSCLNSLKAAKAAGKKTVCELATAHAPAAIRILNEEQALHPEWADSIDNVSFPPDYYNRLCEEPQIADEVIGASAFTIQTLKENEIDEKKLNLLPLGFDVERIPYSKKEKTGDRPLKILFAGRITQRKGIKYLLEAVKKIPPTEVELHLIGHVHGSGKGLTSYANYVKHAPLSQHQLFKAYSEFDLLALPSVFEGFGLVILEAMAAGLPVITTPHTFGGELIRHRDNGYLVPVRDVTAIENSITEFLALDSSQRIAMSASARATAVQYTWDFYKKNLEALLKKFE